MTMVVYRGLPSFIENNGLASLLAPEKMVGELEVLFVIGKRVRPYSCGQIDTGKPGLTVRLQSSVDWPAAAQHLYPGGKYYVECMRPRLIFLYAGINNLGEIHEYIREMRMKYNTLIVLVTCACELEAKLEVFDEMFKIEHVVVDTETFRDAVCGVSAFHALIPAVIDQW